MEREGSRGGDSSDGGRCAIAAPEEILTVGHSNHELVPFVELLRSAGIELLVDVRQNPRSRYEHFNRSPLAGAMAASGIGYEHLGHELGGRREPADGSPNDAWEDDAFRGYADHMASAEFADGLARLKEMAAERRTAVMCAEGDWSVCHRRLIADALVADGIRVLHLGPDGSLAAHELNEDALIGADGTVTYPEPQTSLEI